MMHCALELFTNDRYILTCCLAKEELQPCCLVYVDYIPGAFVAWSTTNARLENEARWIQGLPPSLVVHTVGRD